MDKLTTPFKALSRHLWTLVALRNCSREKDRSGRGIDRTEGTTYATKDSY